MRKIMVAWDGSKTAARAFEKAAEIAARFGSDLFVVSVADIPDYVQTTGEYRGRSRTRSASSSVTGPPWTRRLEGMAWNSPWWSYTGIPRRY